jgi:hypothetical protein
LLLSQWLLDPAYLVKGPAVLVALVGLLSACATGDIGASSGSVYGKDVELLHESRILSNTRQCDEAENKIRQTRLSQANQLLFLARIADECRMSSAIANSRLQQAAQLGSSSAADTLKARGLVPPALRNESASSVKSPNLSLDDILKLQQIVNNAFPSGRRGSNPAPARDQLSCTQNGWLLECSRGRQQISCTRNGSLIQCTDGTSCQANGNLITCN